MNIKTHTIRLFPSVVQEAKLINLNRLRNIIWNNLIAIREKHYKSTGKGLSDFELMNYITKLKQDNPGLFEYNSKAAQTVAKQIGAAYRSFFKLRKNGDFDAKPPKVIREDKPTSITFNQSGWRFKDSNITISKLSEPISYKSKNKIDDLNIKEIRIKHINNKWLCDIVEEYPDNYQENNSNKILAIDLGLKTLATCVDNTGKVIILPNKAKKIATYFDKEISKVQTKIDKKKKYNKRQRRLIKIKRKLYNRRNAQVRQALHIQSKMLANMKYHTVVLGDLSVKELMSKEKNNKKNVRKSFVQSAIDMFRTFLTYKCAGKINVVEIDERHTTQLNCLTGKKFPKKIELKDRTVQLTDTIIIDRDLNSAINILKRWESFHLAALTPPLSLDNVLKKNNLFERTPRL